MVTVAMTAMTKNPTKKTLSKVTMPVMTTVLHLDLEIDWSSVPFSTVHCVCILGVLRSLRCCCLLCIGQEWLRVVSFSLLFCQILPCRTACILVGACAFGPRGSAHDRSAFVLLPGIQAISCFPVVNFVIPQSFHDVDLFESAPTLNCEIPGTYMMNPLLIRCSACFFPSSVMPRGMLRHVRNVSPSL